MATHSNGFDAMRSDHSAPPSSSASQIYWQNNNVPNDYRRQQMYPDVHYQQNMMQYPSHVQYNTDWQREMSYSRPTASQSYVNTSAPYAPVSRHPSLALNYIPLPYDHDTTRPSYSKASSNRSSPSQSKRYFSQVEEKTTADNNRPRKKQATVNNSHSSGTKVTSSTASQVEVTSFYCDICRIKCPGKESWEQHIVGSRHLRAEQMKSSQTLPSQLPQGLKCVLCNIVCSGPEAYSSHLAGSKHAKVAKLAKEMGKEIPNDKPTAVGKQSPQKSPPIEVAVAPSSHNLIIANGEKFATQLPGKSSTEEKKVDDDHQKDNPLDLTKNCKDKDETSVTDDEAECPLKIVESPLKNEMRVDKCTTPTQAAETVDCVRETPAALPIEALGLQYIEEFAVQGKPSSYFCKLCDCKIGDPVAKEQHVRGKRHRVNFRRKHE